MVYRHCPDLPPPSDADLDTPETVEASTAIARGERHLHMLAELAEITMSLARSIAELAQARIEEVKTTEAVLAPGEDPAAAFSKISQTLRRTIDLESRLADQVNTRRADLATARSAKRTELDEQHKTAKDGAIDAALSDAFLDAYPEPDSRELEEVLFTAEAFRSEYDEFRDYLKRPVGETVARFCEILNLDPTCCIRQGETWMVRRRHQEHETTRDLVSGAPVWPAVIGSSP